MVALKQIDASQVDDIQAAVAEDGACIALNVLSGALCDALIADFQPHLDDMHLRLRLRDVDPVQMDHRVRGVLRRGNKVSTTEYSNVSCATTASVPPAAGPPADLVATAGGSSSVDLSWTDNSDEQAFEIERCAGAACSDFAILVQVGADVTTFTDAALDPDAELCYRVRGIVDGSIRRGGSVPPPGALATPISAGVSASIVTPAPSGT